MKRFLLSFFILHSSFLISSARAPIQAEAFALRDVELLPSRFYDNMRRDSAFLAGLSAATLVHNFQTNAGVYAGREGGYMTVEKMGGWESADCELRGHFTGHALSALAMLYANTGSAALKAKGDSVVAALAEVQQVLGGGYLSAFPEQLIRRNLAGKSVWAPWYTLHKILTGLICQYQYADNRQALDVARGMARWAYALLHGQSEDTRRLMLRNEFGGISEAFYNLYAITADQEALWLAQWFYHNAVLDPLLARNADFGKQHTNTFIPKVIGEARRYELTGGGGLLPAECSARETDIGGKKPAAPSQARHLAEFFWQEMTARHCFATGELSDKEHFFPPAQLSRHLSAYTGEACCTYNMLRLTSHLFCWQPRRDYADYYERALYNHILGQQDPQSGMYCYFMPLQSGAYKLYSTPRRSFWCCVGSGTESNAKYAEAIYYHKDATLWVNLFIPSRLTWREQGLTITQRTGFPATDNTQFIVHLTGGGGATLRLRCPAWCAAPEVRVNGKRVKARPDKSGYIVLARTWHDGDTIDYRLPMSLHFEATPDDPDRAALLYGPIVLAAEAGTEGMTAPAPFSDPDKYNDYYTYDFHVPATLSDTLAADRQHPESAITRASRTGLVFQTADGHTLRPFYDVHHQRYIVYWHLSR